VYVGAIVVAVGAVAAGLIRRRRPVERPAFAAELELAPDPA
jgi:hypothetical protein